MQKGRYIAANNVSKIPERKLRIMMDIIEARHAEIEQLWLKKIRRDFVLLLNLQSNRLSWGNMVLVEKGRIGADPDYAFNIWTGNIIYDNNYRNIAR